MKHLTRWILALLALTAVAGFSGAWTHVQDTPPKQEQPKKERKLDKPQGQGQGQGKRGAQGAQGGRAAKQAAIKKALPTLKTSLGEAVGLAEKETSGKAFSAGVEIIKEKVSIVVNLYAGEKQVVAHVDPETKKVSVPEKKKEGAEGGGEGEGEGEGEEGG